MENKIHSEQILAGNRTYFIDLKESDKKDTYLVITESKKKSDASFERQSIMIFEEDMNKFSKAFVRMMLKFK